MAIAPAPVDDVENTYVQAQSKIDFTKKVYKWKFVWFNVILLTSLHIFALYGFYVKRNAMMYSLIYAKTIGTLHQLGVTGGAHRLWSHRSYKANSICQFILACMMSFTYQGSIYTWCRDHRLHHKYSETDADPHNANRGFFFSHVGWLMLRKHEDVLEKGKTIDLSDLEENKIIMLQHKYYYYIVVVTNLLLPALVPMYFWGEDPWVSVFYVTIYRFIYSVNLTWSVNSYAHLFGDKPYDKAIGPTDGIFGKYFTFGEGFHNYHHTFPWDYKAAEYHGDCRNVTTHMIDLFAWLGWVTDRKTASTELIDKRASRTGDGSWTEEEYRRKSWSFTRLLKELNHYFWVSLMIYLL